MITLAILKQFAKNSVEKIRLRLFHQKLPFKKKKKLSRHYQREILYLNSFYYSALDHIIVLILQKSVFYLKEEKS